MPVVMGKAVKIQAMRKCLGRPGKLTQKQYFCCLHKRHRGEWEEFWQSPYAIRRHKPEALPV